MRLAVDSAERWEYAVVTCAGAIVGDGVTAVRTLFSVFDDDDEGKIRFDEESGGPEAAEAVMSGKPQPHFEHVLSICWLHILLQITSLLLTISQYLETCAALQRDFASR